MAPRRGGGRYGGGSVSVKCNGNAYGDDYSRTLIAFIALFIVVYIVLAFFIPGKKKRTALNGGQPPRSNGRWTLLGWTIGLEIISLILYVAAYSMQQCGSSFDDYLPVFTAQSWLAAAGLLCLWAAILVPVCKALHKVGGSLMPKLVTVGHSVYIGWLVFLMVAWLSVYTAVQHLDYSDYTLYPTQYELAKASNGLYVTMTVFGLIGMLMAASSMIMALSRSAELRTGAVKIWVYALAFSTIAYSVIDLAIFIRFTYMAHFMSVSEMYDTNLAQTFVARFLFGLMFLSSVFILRDPKVMSGAGAPAAVTYSTVPNPVEPQYNEQPQPPLAYNAPPTYGYQGANYQNYPAQQPQGQTYYQQ